jgi:hypothetical protein
MKLGLTGISGLSRKLFATMLMALSVSTFAADNSIYIDQMGDNATISVTQDGSGNAVRGIQGVGTSNATPAKIYGDGTLVAVTQIGANNTLNLGITSTIAAGAGTGTSVTYSVTGNNATATINSNANGQGTSASNTIGVTQSGNYAAATVNVLGANNQLSITTSGGNNNIVTATQNGDNNNTIISNTGGGGNSTTTSQTGDKGMINISTVGASNTTTVTQSGGGINGHSATVDISGSSNNTTIVQAGTSADSIVNLKSVGSTNTFNINTNTR